jgi:hypothetical protein
LHPLAPINANGNKPGLATDSAKNAGLNDITSLRQRLAWGLVPCITRQLAQSLSCQTEEYF